MSFMFWLGMAFAVGIAILLYALRHWLPQVRHYDAHYHVQTEDGWSLGLYRYAATEPTHHPASSPTPDATEPRVVVCCADIGEEPLLWEWGEEGGWAKRLQQDGYEVWIACLRGTDLGTPRYLDARYGWGWNLETVLQWDLPAIMRSIQQYTGQQRILWMGRGFGGYLPLLNPEVKASIDGVVWLGGGLGAGQRLLDRGLSWVLYWWPWTTFPLRLFIQCFAPFVSAYHWLKRKIKHTPRSLEEKAAASFQSLTRGLCTVSTSLYRQWLQTLQKGSWFPPTGASFHDIQEDPLETFDSSTIPLFLVGSPPSHMPLRANHPQSIELAPAQEDESSESSGGFIPNIRQEGVLTPLISTDYQNALYPQVREWFRGLSS